MLRKIKTSLEIFQDRYAIKTGEKLYSYSALAQIISDIRTSIDNNCSRDEKLIGIIARESTDFETYGSIYGALFAGKGYVPINPANPVERNQSVVNQTGIKTILCSIVDEEIEKFAYNNKLKIINTSCLNQTEINLNLPQVSDDDIAYILFTSGSTGIPKGVPITRGNLSAFVDAFIDLGYDINENDKFLQMFELTFDFSVVCYIVPVCIGASFYTVPAEGIKFANVYTTIEENEITFSCLVPSVISYLKPYFEEISLPKLKYSLFCGESLYQDIAAAWSECMPNGRIINAYGPTEATVFCLTFDWNKYGSEQKTLNGGVSIGREMKGMKAIVVDEKLKALKPGEKGELCLSGPQLTPGYWRDQVKTSETFFIAEIDDQEFKFYRTGDLALVDGDGDFMFCGRLDSQIKIQGFRIELGEIEHFAREYSLNNVAAVAYKNNKGTMNIHLFVENFRGSINEISEYLKTKVPEYMVPSGISVLSNLPLNANGKTDRKELLNLIQN